MVPNFWTAGFEYLRTKGSHKGYRRDKERFILPFHKGKILHPNLVYKLYDLIEKGIELIERNIKILIL